MAPADQLERVVAKDSTGFARSGSGDTVVIPGNNGDCLLAASGGAGNTVELRVRNLSDSRGTTSTPANLTVEDLGDTERAAIDLGGGRLGSIGRNCLGGGNLAAAIMGYDVHARGNWWGRPGGAGPGRAVVAGGSLDEGNALAAPPAGC